MIISINNVYYAYILAIIFGLYVGISETIQRAIIPKYVTTELRGTSYGFNSLVIGVCFFASNITFGFIWDNYNIQMAVGYGISLSLSAIMGMIIFIKSDSKASTNSIT